MVKFAKGSFEMMKQLNERIILQQIRDNGPISRAEIAKRTELTPPTVSKVVLELIDAGFVLETEIGESNGGRRPILLAMNPRGGYALGLAISAHEIEVLLTDLEMTPLARTTTPLHTAEPLAVTSQAGSMIQELLAKTAIPRERILGVGVALHGAVDHEQGISLFAPHLQWQRLPIRQLLESNIHFPVVVDNDVRLMAVGEMWKGAARGIESFAYVNVDYGVGTGIVLRGELLRGGNYAAGELGHMMVEANGPLCRCGKRGCLEALISLAAMEGLDGDKIRQTVGTYLGRGLAAMIHLLDLRRVILGGRVLSLTEGILAAVREEFRRQILPWMRENTEIIPGDLGGDARIMGAVTMIISKFYNGGIKR